jgi:hypothetical protein
MIHKKSGKEKYTRYKEGVSGRETLLALPARRKPSIRRNIL